MGVRDVSPDGVEVGVFEPEVATAVGSAVCPASGGGVAEGAITVGVVAAGAVFVGLASGLVGTAVVGAAVESAGVADSAGVVATISGVSSTGGLSGKQAAVKNTSMIRANKGNKNFDFIGFSSLVISDDFPPILVWV